MDDLDLKTTTLLNQDIPSVENLFDDVVKDYKTMALALIEFNQAIQSMGDHLRQSLLTYSLRSTKKQNKG
jgi:hypothetical protein